MKKLKRSTKQFTAILDQKPCTIWKTLSGGWVVEYEDTHNIRSISGHELHNYDRITIVEQSENYEPETLSLMENIRSILGV